VDDRRSTQRRVPPRHAGEGRNGLSFHDHVIAASAQFLRSPEPGPITVMADVLHPGRSASHVRARMQQDDRDCVEALLTVSQLDPSAKPYWDRGVPAPSEVPLDETVLLTTSLPSGDDVALTEQVSVRSVGRLRKGEWDASIVNGSTPSRRAVTSASQRGCARSCRQRMKLRGRSAAQNRGTEIRVIAVSSAFSGVSRPNAQRAVSSSQSW
jgi:stress-induced morphogen